jgi:hypothetical protein
MRKLFVNPVIVLSLIASMFFVSSCEKEGEIVESDLIGTWEMGQVSVDMMVGPISLKQFLLTALQLPEVAADALVDQLTAEFMDIGGGTITFNEDYSYALIDGDLGEAGTWSLDGKKLYMVVTGEIVDNDPLTVNSLSSAAAIVSWEEEQEVDVDEDGTADFTATIVIELNLSKQ